MTIDFDKFINLLKLINYKIILIIFFKSEGHFVNHRYHYHRNNHEVQDWQIKSKVHHLNSTKLAKYLTTIAIKLNYYYHFKFNLDV